MRTTTLILTAALAGTLAACSGQKHDEKKADGAHAPAAAASTDTMPSPKAGLWEQTVSGPAIPGATTVKFCQGPATPGSNPFNTPQPGVTCSKNEVNKSPAGVTFEAVCETQGVTVSTKGNVTGDLDAAYKVEITTNTTGANIPPQMAATSFTVDAKRIGDCPAGTAPNTLVP